MSVLLHLQNLRKKNDLTINEVASSLGIEVELYRSIEKGEVELTENQAQQLADLFGVSIQEILPAKVAPIVENQVVTFIEKIQEIAAASDNNTNIQQNSSTNPYQNNDKMLALLAALIVEHQQANQILKEQNQLLQQLINKLP